MAEEALSDADLEREFLSASMKRSEFMAANNARGANKQYDKMYQLKPRIRALADRGEAMLKRLARHTNVDVQMAAATMLLALDEHFASELLNQIALGDHGLESLTAEMTLQEWRNGAIRDYWS